MDIIFDLNRFYSLANNSPFHLVWYFFMREGWVILILFSLYAYFLFWLYYRRKKFLRGIPQTLLAIDIPKNNEQSLLAVEQIFAALAGIKSGPTLWEKYWLGKVQLSLSLEIISLEGYIQFLIRTPTQFQDLVEAAVYAQYPEAEITEVDDYIDIIPNNASASDELKFWGTELNLDKQSVYPLKTYPLFEHSLSQSFVDPMASLLEVMSKLGPGEQLGLQIVIAPEGEHWKQPGVESIKKIIGAEGGSKKNIGDAIINTSLEHLEKFSETVYSLWGDIKKKEDQPAVNKYLFLTTNEKFTVEMMQNKLSKICFAASMRIYYLAHKDVYHRGRGINAIIGSLNQFNSSDLNAFKKYKPLTTDRDYFFIKQRVGRIHKKLVRLYKERSMHGSPKFFLSTEELATIYHFPTITVKAPLLQKATSKKAEPPVSLPLESRPISAFFQPKHEGEHAGGTAIEEPKEDFQDADKIADKVRLQGKQVIQEHPEKKFVIQESLAGYDFDNDYFEQQFSKRKETVVVSKQETPGKVEDENQDAPSNLPFVE